MNCWAALGEKHNIGPQEAELVLKNIRTAYGRFVKRRKTSLLGQDVPIFQFHWNLATILSDPQPS